jgi:hypothetical protein
MKTMMIALFVVAVVAAAASGTSSKQREGKMQVKNEEKAQAKKNESLFYCRLDALTKEERERHLTLWKGLQASRQEVRELADGYAIRFPGDAKHLLDVAEFISRERRCCPFFTFEMEVSGEDKPLWLRLRGQEGVKEFIRTEIGIK